MEVTLTDTAQSLSVTLRVKDRPRIARVSTAARLSGDDLPGAAGDSVQFLGRKSRRVAVKEAVFYNRSLPATEKTNLQLLLAWQEYGTVLTYQSPVHQAGVAGTFRCYIESVDVYEDASPAGVSFDLALVETDATPTTPPGTVPVLPPSSALPITSEDLIFVEDLLEADGIDVGGTGSQGGEAVTPAEGMAQAGGVNLDEALHPAEVLVILSGTGGTPPGGGASPGTLINIAVAPDNTFTEELLVSN